MVDTISNTTLGPALVVAFNDNATALATLQNQVTQLAAALGNAPANAYAAPTTNNYFTYSGNASIWTTATKNGATATFGSPYNAQTLNPASGSAFPTITALPWSSTQKSILFGYTLSSFTTYVSQSTSASYGAFRRVALDGSNAPTIVSAEVLQPYQSTGSYTVPSAFPMFSGVSVSDSSAKSLGMSTIYANGVTTAWWQSKYTAGWDGTNFTIVLDGSVSNNNGGTNIFQTAANGASYSANIQGELTNANAWISPGTLGYDLNILDTGAGTGVSFSQERYSAPTPTHDFAGGGMTMAAMTTTTTLDGTSRLTLLLQTNDSLNGNTQIASYRVGAKTYSGGLSIGSLSENLWLVQFTDASSNRWAGLLVYTPSTNVLTLYNNTWYNGGNLGAQALGANGFARFSATVNFGLRLNGSFPNAKLMRTVFDSTRTGLELASDTANDIPITLCSGVASVTGGGIHGMIQMGPNLIVIFGRVTAGGVTTCFVDSFTLS